MESSDLATLALSAVALSASGVMAWRAIDRQRRVPESEKARQMRRFTRRRLIMSVLVGLVGAALLWYALALDAWFQASPHPNEFSVFWLGILVALLALVGLSIADGYAVLHAQLSEHYKKENWADLHKRIGKK